MKPSLDATALYHAWEQLDNGSRARLRRTATPDELLDIPAFYALVSPFGWPEQRHALLRIVFCLACGKITPAADTSLSLGKVLAKGEKVSAQRIYQLLRMASPQDMIQLRRLLIHAEPTLHWPSLAKQLHWWGKSDRRALLEDFVLSMPKKDHA
ncbi:type I-E CRISPR-associated protein Cse2/CasB [Pantoea sp. 1.19]|uniref:type I-E CRISPR-associated protein Cse2/CasB n=1 Tax=Pantoea sp. 1.19 TaxID=1925589 RepID=UPI000948A3E0|nr:type I-E CRISPR-associated protein Cse2/CasB [Pantoea sp. 1.19]